MSEDTEYIRDVIEGIDTKQKWTVNPPPKTQEERDREHLFRQVEYLGARVERIESVLRSIKYALRDDI